MDLPDELRQTLSQVQQAQEIFDNLSDSHKREYIKWVNEAKRPETRQSRAEKTVKLILEKSRNKN